MRNTTTLLLTLSLAPLLAACGSDGAGSGGGQARASAAASASHPCEAYTVSDVASRFGVEEGAIAVERTDGVGGTMCEYRWPKPDAEEIRERVHEATMAALMPGGGGLDAIPKEREDVALTITFPTEKFGSPADAREALDAMVRRLEDGISSSAGDQTFTVQASFEPSPGVADGAFWSAKLRQVSAVSGKQLYHVKLHDHVDPAEDRARAEEVARAIGGE